MKSIFLLSSLLFLFSCGKEQFGTAVQQESKQADSLKSFTQSSCSSFTLIRPKVDIIYIIDNSYSTHYLSAALKTSVKKTLSSISSDFDYRVISTPLLSNDNNNYSVFTNSSEQVPIPSKIVLTPEALIDPIFANLQSGSEKGLSRAIQFMTAHTNSGLLRNGAYHLMILVSNGRDEEIETALGTSNEETIVNQTLFNQKFDSFKQIRLNLASQQLRLFSATASFACHEGWRDSRKSYQKMSEELYALSGATDSSTNDTYDLCGTGLQTLFSGVNNSIQKVLQKHEYRYWPISFADSNETTVDLTKLKVYKVSNNSAQLMDPSTWTYYKNESSTPLNTRELPTPGEPVSGKHFIRFDQRVVYPDCVQVTSTTKTEYFGYITLPRKPIINSIVVKINGIVMPSSKTNGWSYHNFVTNPINIKMPYPTADHQYPAVMKSGFMIKLNGEQNYYKSGDSVEVNYQPDAIE
ncbi:MAG TPA: hypothetical protein VKZ84_00345 [Bacteriovoracaceae bacterium]|nr:hypothetical protein [Bacteriovoracaceae bacterium]